MQIENNRVKEEAEAAKFELTNKILQLEIAFAEASEDKRRLTQTFASSKEKMEEAEKRKKEIEAELTRLQSSNSALNAAYDKQAFKHH